MLSVATIKNTLEECRSDLPSVLAEIIAEFAFAMYIAEKKKQVIKQFLKSPLRHVGIEYTKFRVVMEQTVSMPFRRLMALEYPNPHFRSPAVTLMDDDTMYDTSGMFARYLGETEALLQNHVFRTRMSDSPTGRRYGGMFFQNTANGRYIIAHVTYRDHWGHRQERHSSYVRIYSCRPATQQRLFTRYNAQNIDLRSVQSDVQLEYSTRYRYLDFEEELWPGSPPRTPPTSDEEEE